MKKLFAIRVILFLSICIFCNVNCDDKCTDTIIPEYILKVRPVFIFTTNNFPQEDVPTGNYDFQYKVVKRHCNGKLGDLDFLQGQSNSSGIYESPYSFDLKINNTLDQVVYIVEDAEGDELYAKAFFYDEYGSSTFFSPSLSIIVQ